MPSRFPLSRIASIPMSLASLALLIALAAAPAAARAAAATREPARAPSRAGAGEYDPSLFSALRWRLVGPFRGGRASAVTGVRGEPHVFYMGACGGGVWRTTDTGQHWECISDSSFGTGSVGAIGVAPSDPNVIYVGMGEETIRGNVSHGDGVYRSTDGGHTWAHVGLEQTSQISRVRVDPRNPDVVYVAAIGHLFGPNPERGIFRSKDGGRSWERILFVDERTGASDLAMDPTNPRVLYAGMWQVDRKPWTLESGGPGSGLWKSIDGGDTWKCLSKDRPGNGLPKGVLGKINVSVSGARPERVFAMVEAEEGGLYRSDDAGRSWTRVNEENDIRQRAWYFNRCYADPRDADKVYVLNVRMFGSKDGGRTFRPIRAPHGDNHDLWIDPDDTDRMVECNDGGATVSTDGGETWSTVDNQPTAQFYHVVTDRQFPYRLYGSQQDNSTVSIPSRTTGFGIEPTDWYDVGGGESGWIAPSRDNPDVIFAGSYDGYLTRFDVKTQQRRDVNPYPDNPMGAGAEAAKYRFQWTYPIVTSPHDPKVLYAAANVLFRSRDEGQSWEAISPDLTRNDPTKLGPSGGPITKDNTTIEYYCTIFTVAESPKQAGVIWCGTDDGLIQLTTDGGKSWHNVTPRELPEWSQINTIEPSPHDAATAFASVVRYKLDDFRPYVYVTHDFGRSWRKIVGGLPENVFVRAVREDPVRRGLLYAGLENGVWISFDEGAHWQPLQRNLPVVPVTDLEVHGDDLAISTQGRSFWILDDLGLLRQLTPEAAHARAGLFDPSPAIRMAGGGFGFPRADVGQNPPVGARIRFALDHAPPDSVPVRIAILDAAGDTLRAFDRKGEVLADTAGAGKPAGPKVPANAGTNEFVWDLRGRAPTRLEGLALWGRNPPGTLVTPGRYQVRLTVGSQSITRPFDVVKDPRLTTSDEDFAKQHDLLEKIRLEFDATHDAVRTIRDVRQQLDAAVMRATRAGHGRAIADSAKTLKKRLTDIEEALVQTKSKAEEDPLNFPIRLDNKLSLLSETVASADARPTDQSYTVWNDLSVKVDAQLARLAKVVNEGLGAFNRLVREQEVPAVVPKPAARMK